MEVQGQGSAVDRVVIVLRRVTRAAQLLPFAYLAVYAFMLLTEPFLSDGLFCIVDDLACVSPASMGVMLLASYLLKLCIWNKVACLLPMASRVTEYIDNYIITFTQTEVVVINTILGIAVLAFMVAAFRHIFCKWTRTR